MAQHKTHNKPRFHSPKTGRRRFDGMERKYNSALGIIRRGNGRRNLDLQTQIDLAHTIDTIERHGFEFFPKHYISKEVSFVCDVADKLKPFIEDKNNG